MPCFAPEIDAYAAAASWLLAVACLGLGVRWEHQPRGRYLACLGVGLFLFGAVTVYYDTIPTC